MNQLYSCKRNRRRPASRRRKRSGSPSGPAAAAAAAVLLAAACAASPPRAFGELRPPTGGETNTRAVKKLAPASAPAIDITSADLPDAADLAAAGHYRLAIKILTRIYPRYKKDPRYFVIRACAYAGVGNHALAAGGFKYAARLKSDLAEAYALCGLAHAHMGRVKEAGEQLALCERRKPTDPLLLYTLGLARFRLRQWEESKGSFKKVGTSKGPIGREAKARLADVEKCRKADAEAVGKHEEAMTKARNELTKAGYDLFKTKADGRKVVAERESLRQAYEKERRAVERDYAKRVGDIQMDYMRRMPPVGPTGTNQGASARPAPGAERRRERQAAEAKRDRDKRLRDIDDRYRPKVKVIDSDIKKLEDEVRRLLGEQVKLKRKLADLLKAERNRKLKSPFDVKAESKKVTAWTCKKFKSPLSDSGGSLRIGPAKGAGR